MELINEMSGRIEKIRRQVEYFEENPENQVTEWKAAMDVLALLFKDVAKEHIFSANEEFPDIKTEDIKYLLIPYYQAELIQKFMDSRLDKIKLAFKFYDEFFKILELYRYLTKDVYITYFYKIRELKCINN